MTTAALPGRPASRCRGGPPGPGPAAAPDRARRARLGQRARALGSDSPASASTTISARSKPPASSSWSRSGARATASSGWSAPPRRSFVISPEALGVLGPGPETARRPVEHARTWWPRRGESSATSARSRRRPGPKEAASPPSRSTPTCGSPRGETGRVRPGADRRRRPARGQVPRRARARAGAGSGCSRRCTRTTTEGAPMEKTLPVDQRRAFEMALDIAAHAGRGLARAHPGRGAGPLVPHGGAGDARGRRHHAVELG